MQSTDILARSARTDRQIFIDYAPHVVGPCRTCRAEQVGSGPVAFSLELNGTRAWLCDACLKRERPQLGVVMSLLQGIRTVGALLVNCPEGGRSQGLELLISRTLIALAESSTGSAAWLPRATGEVRMEEETLGVMQGELRTGRIYELLLRGQLKLTRIDAWGENGVAFTYLATWNQMRGYWRVPYKEQQRTEGSLRLLDRIADARVFRRHRFSAPPLSPEMIYEVVQYDALHLVRLNKVTSGSVEFERVATWSRDGHYLPAPLSDWMPLEEFRQLLRAAYDRSAA